MDDNGTYLGNISGIYKECITNISIDIYDITINILIYYIYKSIQHTHRPSGAATEGGRPIGAPLKAAPVCLMDILMDTDKTSLRLIRRIGGGGKDSPRKHKGKRAKQEQEQQQEDMLAPRDPATGITSSRAPTRSAENPMISRLDSHPQPPIKKHMKYI